MHCQICITINPKITIPCKKKNFKPGQGAPVSPTQEAGCEEKLSNMEAKKRVHRGYGDATGLYSSVTAGRQGT